MFSGVVLYGSAVAFCTFCKPDLLVFSLIGMGVEFKGTGFLKPHQPAVDFLNDSVVQEPAKL